MGLEGCGKVGNEYSTQRKHLERHIWWTGQGHTEYNDTYCKECWGEWDTDPDHGRP